MKRIFLISIILTMALSCTKEVLQTTGERVGEKEVPAASGSFVAFVEAQGVWNARPVEDWLNVDPSWHKDDFAIEVEYDSNESTQSYFRFNRLGHILICTHDGFTVDTLVVRQRGSLPVMTLEESVEVSEDGGEVSVAFTTNLSDRERPQVELTVDAGWISSLQWGKDGSSIVFNADNGVNREAVVTVTFTDGWGQKTSASCNVIQN